MKTILAQFSVIDYKGEPIDVIPLSDVINNSIQHIVGRKEMKEKDFDKVVCLVKRGGGVDFCNLGECEVQWYEEHLKNNKLDKIFKHRIVTKELKFY